MPACVIKYCKNYSSKTKKKDGVSYFCFPRDPIRRAMWMAIISQENGEEFFKPTLWTVICSDHFKDSDMYVTNAGLRRLLNTALPRLQNDDMYLIDDQSCASSVTSNSEQDIKTDTFPGDYPTTSSMHIDIKSPNAKSMSINSILDSARKVVLNKNRACRRRLEDIKKKVDNLQKKNKRLVKKNRTLKNAFILLKKKKGMRIKYKNKDDTFLEKNLVAKEPSGQFKAWFDEVCTRKDILEPNAMCLATVSKDGLPSARFVLCKGYGKDGYKFFTNYGSRKANEMDSNPNVAATFYWAALNRSVRIEGHVDKLSEDESSDYFHSRPVPSQIAACVSRQSKPIESRDVLCDGESVFEAKYSTPGLKIPKPDYWGGYIIRPKTVEFWQGQSDRLHDRIKFRKPKDGEVPDGKILHKGEDGWVFERLSP